MGVNLTTSDLPSSMRAVLTLRLFFIANDRALVRIVATFTLKSCPAVNSHVEPSDHDDQSYLYGRPLVGNSKVGTCFAIVLPFSS
jgi:hypothetical protein